MTTLTEGQHAGEFLVSEAPCSRSRESVTVISGQNLKAGAVLGRIIKALAAAPNPTVSGTGDGTMTNVKLGKAGKTGSYVVTCTTAVTNGGVFSVVDPDGNALPDLTLTVGAGASTNYVSDQIEFTVTDGSTDFAADDSFTIVVTAAGTPTVVGTGNGVMSAISLGKFAKNGTYRVECVEAGTNAGTFQIVDPDGNRVGTPEIITGGAGGTAVFANDHVNFTLTDGATDFAAGDYFNILVAAGSKKVTAWAPSAVDGSQDVAGILFDNTDASAADLAGVMVARDAEVNASELQYATAISAAQQVSAKAYLANLGIIAR
jgi:predicted enzyme related to lactoylglutathione lyase